EVVGKQREWLGGGRGGWGREWQVGADRYEHVNLARRDLAIVSLVAFDIRRLDVIKCEVAAFLITQFGHSLEKIGIDRRLPGLNADKPDTQHLRLLLRPRLERQADARATEQHYELAASHCPMPPVLPSERIAHLGTVDCCIHPPGRNEMIAITPPIISSKEVAQNRPPHLPRQQPPSAPEIVLRRISRDGAW